ncbi:MAG: DUF6036 family nucleotidyltransferase [Verrucomicrobiota bacterium]
MQRHELEHIIRASAGITGRNRFIIVGSQAVLGQFPEAPAELLVSREADIYCPEDPSATDLIDGTIGELSPFEQSFRYYAHGVGPETAVVPAGWEDRLVPVHSEFTGGATAFCLEAHDLAISKLVAGREKDFKFVTALFHHGMVELPVLAERLATTELHPERRHACEGRLTRLSAISKI